MSTRSKKSASPSPFEAAAREYIAARASPLTRQNYTPVLDAWLEHCQRPATKDDPGHPSLSTATAFRDELVARKLQPETVDSKLLVLSAIYTHCLQARPSSSRTRWPGR